MFEQLYIDNEDEMMMMIKLINHVEVYEINISSEFDRRAGQCIMYIPGLIR